MASLPEFQRIQKAFCAHLRDPRQQPGPADIEDRRMAIYRDLFSKNIYNLLRGSFPVIARLLTEEELTDLAYDFFARHGCRTPYFHRIGEEFVAYLAQPETQIPDAHPYLPELAHYEWTDTAVRLSDAEMSETGATLERDGPLLEYPLAWTPHLQLCTYTYPVHRINEHYQPEAPPDTPTFLLVFRDPKDAVKFVELNPASARLVALLLDQSSMPASAHLDRLADDMGREKDPAIRAGGQEILERLRTRGAIWGVWRNPS